MALRASTMYAFAALKSDGTVVTWGNPSYGGNAPSGLSNVGDIKATKEVFLSIPRAHCDNISECPTNFVVDFRKFCQKSVCTREDVTLCCVDLSDKLEPLLELFDCFSSEDERKCLKQRYNTLGTCI